MDLFVFPTGGSVSKPLHDHGENTEISIAPEVLHKATCKASHKMILCSSATWMNGYHRVASNTLTQCNLMVTMYVDQSRLSCTATPMDFYLERQRRTAKWTLMPVMMYIITEGM